jgi:hypothetical protein
MTVQNVLTSFVKNNATFANMLLMGPRFCFVSGAAIITGSISSNNKRSNLVGLQLHLLSCAVCCNVAEMAVTYTAPQRKNNKINYTRPHPLTVRDDI